MPRPTQSAAHLQQRIAQLFLYGTWLGSVLIAAGILLNAVSPVFSFDTPIVDGSNLMKCGIALFIIMPIARVLLMLSSFLRQRDPLYAIISVIVLMTILISAFMR